MLKLLDTEPDNYSPHAYNILKSQFNVDQLSIINRISLIKIIGDYNITYDKVTRVPDREEIINEAAVGSDEDKKYN